MLQQRNIIDRWKNGKNVCDDVLFCTTCCAQCVDAAKVRLVIVTYVEESVEILQQIICRAGRDGKLGKAVLFHPPFKFEVLNSTKNIYEGSGCIRSRIHLELEGTKTMCSQPDSLCSACGKKNHVCVASTLSVFDLSAKAPTEDSEEKGND